MTAQRKMHFFISCIYFFIILGGGVNMLINGPSDFRNFTEERSQLTNVVFLANGGLLCLIYFAKPINVFKNLHGFFFFFLLFSAMLLSVSVSYDPVRSLTIIVFFSINTFATLYICSTIDPVNVLRCLGFACLASVILSFVLIFGLPSYGRMTYVFPGAWQGIFIHKNVLGKFATLALIVSLCLRDYWSKNLWLSAIALSLTLAVGTGSATSTMACGIIIGSYLAAKNRIFMNIGLSFLCVFAILAFFYIDQILNLLTDSFDKSATLSGRTTLWELSFHFINTHPWLGYGLGAFWKTPDAEALRAVAGWEVPHAHNGILELALNIGYIGVAAYLALFFVLIRLSMQSIKSGSDSILLFPFLIVVHTIIYAIGEANLIRPNSYTEVMIVISCSSVYKFMIEASSRSKCIKNLDRKYS